MKIPIIETIGLNEKGLISAEDVLKTDKLLPDYIDLALIFFDHSPDQDLIDECELLFNFIAASSVLPQYIYKDKIVISYAPLGGPAAGGLIEELRAYGVKKIIACGSSGLIGDIDASNFLLVTKAIRDEGLSYQYLEPSIYVETSKSLNDIIKAHLQTHNLKYIEGIAWTTDGFFRETKSRIALRKEQGAIAVEMECASMAAVCEYYQMPFAQILYFSDIVKQDGWSGFVDKRKNIKNIINKVMINIGLEM